MAKTSRKTEAQLGAETVGTAAVEDEVGAAPRVTKKDAVIALLRRVQGASLAEICEATGWQRHTARAALTGLRKAGYVLRSERDAGGDGQMRYQVTALPPAAE